MVEEIQNLPSKTTGSHTGLQFLNWPLEVKHKSIPYQGSIKVYTITDMSALTERWKPTQVTVIATCLLTVLISELLKVFVALGLFETILNAFVLWVADCTNTYSLVFSFGGWDAEFVYYLALNSRFLCLTSAARQCVCLLTNLAFILYGSLLYTLHF